ncbi:MAG: tetratricopeptide repeat protein [Elusimicrobia bacterium]|nr:tetratricopeptide repeat protein [Elusimicrobiota bacterium]
MNCFEQAERWREKGYFKKAKHLYLKSLKQNSFWEDPIIFLESCLDLVGVLRALSQTREAWIWCAKGKQYTRGRSFEKYRLYFEVEEALLLRAEGAYHKSLAQLSALFRKSSSNLSLKAFLLWALGGTLRFLGRFGESKRVFEHSRALSKKIRDPVGEGYAFSGLGGVSRMQGSLQRSISCYCAALRAFEKTQDLFGRAYAHCGLANGLRQKGVWDSAMVHYRKAWRLYSQIEDPVDLAYVAWGLGKVLEKKTKLLSAAKWLEKSRHIFNVNREVRGEILSEMALAGVWHALGKTGKAERIFQQGYRRAVRHKLHTHLEIFT